MQLFSLFFLLYACFIFFTFTKCEILKNDGNKLSCRPRKYLRMLKKFECLKETFFIFLPKICMNIGFFSLKVRTHVLLYVPHCMNICILFSSIPFLLTRFSLNYSVSKLGRSLAKDPSVKCFY